MEEEEGGKRKGGKGFGVWNQSGSLGGWDGADREAGAKPLGQKSKWALSHAEKLVATDLIAETFSGIPGKSAP